VKFRIQFTPALAGALICTLSWYALWIAVFRPATEQKTRSAVQPEAALQPADARDIPPFSAPTLFALPSRHGFSGSFPPARVNLALQFESPEQPSYALAPGNIREGDPNPAPLFGTVTRPRTQEHLPGAFNMEPVPQTGRVEFFFSPELRRRMAHPPVINPDGELPETVQIRLRVRPDGSVAYAFFDNPVTNPQLIAAIRKLRFIPATEHTTGRLELRCKGGTS
jgi:hypothetical protein